MPNIHINSHSHWFLFPRPVERPRLRLYCFPYAGSGASVPIFRDWALAMPSDVELAVLELPGRGRRIREPAFTSMRDLVSHLLDAFAEMTDVRYAFFGHSVGALVAFELAKAISARKLPAPELLMVSGKRAPHLKHNHNLHRLPDVELIEALKRYNGTPREVLANSELMEMVLGVLRADFSLAETYQHLAEPPLDVPIHAFGGAEDDGVSRSCIEAWSIHTRGGFECETHEGDHFFIQNRGRWSIQARLLGIIEGLRQSIGCHSAAELTYSRAS